jgi:hypothetical protein
MENLVYRTRGRANPDWQHLVESEPFRWLRPDDPRSFWRFTSSIIVGNRVHKFAAFASPEILWELGNTKICLFADCTFQMVPVFFSQVLILMMYFSRYDLYVPIYWILMQVYVFSYDLVCVFVNEIFS